MGADHSVMNSLFLDAAFAVRDREEEVPPPRLTPVEEDMAGASAYRVRRFHNCRFDDAPPTAVAASREASAVLDRRGMR